MSLAVAVDIMSGDAPIAARIDACRRIKRETPEVRVILVGDDAAISPHIAGCEADFAVEHAPAVVAMDEPPTRAIRRADTSMRRVLELTRDGRANAAVSAGNTGALMGLGVLVLRVIDGIERPAIASFVPNRNAADVCCLLDLGANVECSPAMLRDFALMGAALTQATKKVERPTVGLLNVGEEEIKGDKLRQAAAELLRDNPHVNFVGNVEGYDIYRGGADVIVCDGFAGNVALKVSEGLAGMLRGMAQDAFGESLLARVCGFLALPVLSRLKRRLDPRAYNGASLLGLRGVVVKSHGEADEKAFAAALRYAIGAARRDVPALIRAAAAGGSLAAAAA